MRKFFTVFGCIIGILALVFFGFLIANVINKGIMNDYIDSFQQVSFEDQLKPNIGADGVPYFTTDKDFKVMHLTDIHITGGIIGAENDKKALNAVAAMITAEKPDLVIVTGDISFAVPWYGSINNKYAHSYFSRLMENLGVYWTVTLGNHDSENYNFYNRSAVADMYENNELEHCLFSSGPAEIYGEGNHVINIKNTKGFITKSFIMLDSNAYTEDDLLGINWDYDRIHDDQIEWYKTTIENNNAHNQSIFSALPEAEKTEEAEKYLTSESLLFFHIPLKEVRTAYRTYVNNGCQNTPSVSYIDGFVGESDPYVYSSEYDENLFETIVELGSTKGIFYGHDHLNNFVLKYQGVYLSYGFSLDYSAYFGISGKGAHRGCTLIICPPTGDIEIVHENYYQFKYKPLYEKEEVDMRT